MAQNDPISSLATRGSDLRDGARRLARRALSRDVSPRAHAEPPPHPLGGKLEMTYSCNLRCGFCYTDSPRRTLQKTPELSDAEWIEVADQLIASGAIEAVVTGGEPLLRKAATIEVCRRLANAGLGVTLNSNGWFIDDEVAAALAEARGLHVHVSIDGPGPEQHDGQRGMPGSWRRAIGGLDALIRHGVAVHAVHVVTAGNVDHIEETLERLRTLGVTAIRMTPVIEVGAAARDGGWRVASLRLERALDRFRDKHGDSVAVSLQSGEGGSALIRTGRAPAALLVRPNGAVRTDSLNPFTFGHVLDDGLEECWNRVRQHWRDPEIARWKSSISAPTDLPKAEIVAYLDDEIAVGDGAPAAAPGSADPRSAKLPPLVPPRPADVAFDAGYHVEELAGSRRYRAGEVRAGGSESRRMVRRLGDGRIWRLNRTASIVFDTLDGGTPDEAAARLGERFPALPADVLRNDAIDAALTLMRNGLVLPVGAKTVTPATGDSTPDLPQVDPG